MQAAQIDRYGKDARLVVREVPDPALGMHDVLIRVRAAAVNPVDALIAGGGIRPLYPYKMPLTLGNEVAGTVEHVGSRVTRFSTGERVYARLPVDRIGGFAEFVTVDEGALAPIPEPYDFVQAAAIPLGGLTAWQALVDEAGARPGQRLLIPGGSGGMGQLAVPIAKDLGLEVIVTGNERAREHILALGADRYLDYRREDYAKLVRDVDIVLDARGGDELARELSVLKPGGTLVSLLAGPNRAFAERHGITGIKRMLLSLAGKKLDDAAKRAGVTYRFVFCQANGAELERISELVTRRGVRPAIDPHEFTLADAQAALDLVTSGHPQGKVIMRL